MKALSARIDRSRASGFQKIAIAESSGKKKLVEKELLAWAQNSHAISNFLKNGSAGVSSSYS
jgi:hypothetical protein